MPKTLRKSLSVSILTSLLDLSIFTLASLLFIGPALVFSRVFSSTIGALSNFFLNQRWAFKHRVRRKTSAELGKYALTALGAISLGTLIFCLFIQIFPTYPKTIHIVSLALVWLSYSYPMMKGWVFKR